MVDGHDEHALAQQGPGAGAGETAADLGKALLLPPLSLLAYAACLVAVATYLSRAYLSLKDT